MSMKALILAGGGGTRLWPVSRKNTPKQFEHIIGNATLLCATYDRVRKGFAARDIFIATAESQRDAVMAQLPSLSSANLILEPSRRDTASAIGFALSHLAKVDPTATFVIVNSDAYVRDVPEYHRVLAAADRAVAEKPDHVVLIGITPSYPETGYGYIKTGEQTLRLEHRGKTDHVFAVERFVEKPERRTAEEYVAHGGYLWNPTLIVARVDAFLSLYKKHLPVHADLFEKMMPLLGIPAAEKRVQTLFAKLPAVSIDYGILEKEKKMLVIPADFGWADVGHWRTVKDILSSHPAADVVKGRHVGIDSGGNLIYSYSGKLVATAGVHDMIIIETSDALLVCPKDCAQDVKKIVGALQDDRALQKYL